MYHVLVGISTADEDVIHRSLQVTYPDYFVKEHYHVLVAITNGEERGKWYNILRVRDCHQDVIHRSLQSTHPDEIVHSHNRFLQTVVGLHEDTHHHVLEPACAEFPGAVENKCRLARGRDVAMIGLDAFFERRGIHA